MAKGRVVITILVVMAFLAGSLSVAAESNPIKININTATAKELIQLKKIGKKYAQNIINHREKNGEFKAPEDIMKVKGIGAKTFELNKEQITVE